jgi:pimeloyl-ACP methyl ester carboxylesterase
VSSTEPVTPSAIVDGLAVYSIGEGPPLLLMPNPQGMVGESTSTGSLARLLVETGHHVITFDPPGAFASSALVPRLGLDEMVECADRAVEAAGVVPPLPVVGHSQGALAAIALSIDRPHLPSCLILVGAVEGGAAATRRAGGLPFGWSWLEPDFWRFVWLGARLSLGRGSLADQKRLRRIFLRRSYVDKANVPSLAIDALDGKTPAPPRAGWQRSIRGVDLRPRLPEIKVPTLVCVGRHDPQTPVRGNEEIARSVGNGRLEIFERSGHYPFEEEPARFRQVMEQFLSPQDSPAAFSG